MEANSVQDAVLLTLWVLTFVLVVTMFSVVNATGGIISDPVSPDIGNGNMKTMTEENLKVFFQYKPASIGGALPTDDFYYED